MRGMAKHSPWLATSMMFAWMASWVFPLAGFVANNDANRTLAFNSLDGWAFGGWLACVSIIVQHITCGLCETIFEGGAETQPPESTRKSNS